MDFFNFHHHRKNTANGIYNLGFGETPPEFPYSIGIHPHAIDKDHTEDQWTWFRSNITDNCFAIGECGLDSVAPTDEKIQGEIFLKQIQWANEIKKPMIIHCVRKFYEVISYKKYAGQPMIIHGFNKKEHVASDLLSNNFYLSFGKAVLYNLSLQHTLKNTPLNKIFLETDDDDFNIEELYGKTAEIKGISLESLNKQITENLETIKNG